MKKRSQLKNNYVTQGWVYNSLSGQLKRLRLGNPEDLVPKMRRNRRRACCLCHQTRPVCAYYPDGVDRETGKSYGRVLCNVCCETFTFDKWGRVTMRGAQEDDLRPFVSQYERTLERHKLSEHPDRS